MKVKREYNALHFILGCLAVSIILGILLGSTSLGVVWYAVTSLVVAAISFFVLFWLGVLVIVIFRVKMKGEDTIPYVHIYREISEESPKRIKKASEEEIQFFETRYNDWYKTRRRKKYRERKREEDDFPKFIPFDNV